MGGDKIRSFNLHCRKNSFGYNDWIVFGASSELDIFYWIRASAYSFRVDGGIGALKRDYAAATRNDLAFGERIQTNHIRAIS